MFYLLNKNASNVFYHLSLNQQRQYQLKEVPCALLIMKMISDNCVKSIILDIHECCSNFI